MRVDQVPEEMPQHQKAATKGWQALQLTQLSQGQGVKCIQPVLRGLLESRAASESTQMYRTTCHTAVMVTAAVAPLRAH